MKKSLLILVLFILGSCSQSSNVTSPDNISNNSSSVTKTPSTDTPTTIPDNSIGNNSSSEDDGTLDPNDTLSPYPAYPNDPGSSYGKVYEVNTPYINLDNTWGRKWKVRERDYNRINFIWGQILSTFEKDPLGLGIVFGAGVAYGSSTFKNHIDLKNVRPTDKRLQQWTYSTRSYDLWQAFKKESTDYNTKRVVYDTPVKRWKHAVIYQISDEPGWGNTAWTGKYTIGGVYSNRTRLAYVTENNLQTAEDNDDELVVIRMDRPWIYNGSTYYPIQLLFRASINNKIDYIPQNKIYRYSDFNYGYNDRPKYSDFIYAIKGSDKTTLRK